MTIEYQGMFWMRNVCESDLKAIQEKIMLKIALWMD